MSKSLLEALPAIAAAGKRQAAQVLEQLDERSRVTLQTREMVIPSKDAKATDLFHLNRVGITDVEDYPNRLIVSIRKSCERVRVCAGRRDPTHR